MIAAIASFSTTVRAKERVCRKLLLVIIIILIEVGVATHSVPWGHTVRLFTLKGASIRSIMLLALVEEVMGNRLMHTLSTNESTALRYRALFLMLLLASSHLTVGNRLLSIDVVRFHLYRCIKLFLYSLTGFTAIHILIGYAILLLSLRSVIVLSRLVWELASILECAILEVGLVLRRFLLLDLWLWWIHELSIVLYDIDIYHAGLDIWPALLSLKLLDKIHSLRGQISFDVATYINVTLGGEVLLFSHTAVVSVKRGVLVVTLLVRE